MDGGLQVDPNATQGERTLSMRDAGARFGCDLNPLYVVYFRLNTRLIAGAGKRLSSCALEYIAFHCSLAKSWIWDNAQKDDQESNFMATELG